MKRIGWSLLAALGLAVLAAPAVPQISTPPISTPPPGAADESGSYLPDSAVLARVNDRVIRVRDVRERYFDSEAVTRPAGDSLGRAEFLENMVNKEVMGLTALALDKPLSFEDRADLREFTNTALENTFYQRMVGDSIHLTLAEVEAVYPQYTYEQHLRRLQLPDRATGEKLRRDLVAGRIDWRNAVAKYSLDKTHGPEGDLGWVSRTSLKGDIALKAFALPPGAISDVVQDIEGFHLIQCVDRRQIDAPPPLMGVRRLIANDLREAKRAPLVERLYALVRTEAAVTYDTTNILWAVEKFRERQEQIGNRTGINLSGMAPAIDPADTSRVLARTRDRRLTVSQFLEGYRGIPAIMQHALISLEPFVYTIDGIFLEPEFVKLARARGIDKDPAALAMIATHREQLLVEALYQDSVLSHVSVTPEMRRKYYEDHRPEFVAIPRARFARLVRRTPAGAESLVTRIRAGEPVEQIIHADSLQGLTDEGIEEVLENQPNPFIDALFVDLKPGQVTYAGPDNRGRPTVVQLIEREDARPMSFDEVRTIVDESVQNIEAERLLRAFLARHRSAYRIESHPEWVMRMQLTDPLLEFNLD